MNNYGGQGSFLMVLMVGSQEVQGKWPPPNNKRLSGSPERTSLVQETQQPAWINYLKKKKKHKNTSDGRHLPRSRLQKLREKRTNRSREFTAAQNGSVLFCSPKTRLSRLRPAEERLPSMEEKVEKINLWRFSLSFWSLIPSKEPASGASVTSAPPAFLTSCPLWAPPPWIHRQWGEQLELKPKQTFSLFWLLIFSLSKTRKSLTSSNHIVLFCLLFLFFLLHLCRRKHKILCLNSFTLWYSFF